MNNNSLDKVCKHRIFFAIKSTSFAFKRTRLFSLKRILSSFFIGMVIFWYFSVPSIAVETKVNPNVLILNAYHKGYTWTDRQTEGITKKIISSNPDAVIYTEFMDWKRFPNQGLLNDLSILYARKYQSTQLDLVVATDDAALAFALEHRADNFYNAPIVFSGIIPRTASALIGEEKNVTGVYEKMDPSRAINLMHQLQPEVDTIYLIHDTSESGENTAKEVIIAIEQSDVSYTTIDLKDQSFKELQKTVQTLPENSIIMMVSYNVSIDGEVQKPEFFGKILSEKSSVPIYSVDEFLFGAGALGGSFLNGVLQGEAAGSLGVSILQGERADSLAHISDATVYDGVDMKLMERFNLKQQKLLSSVSCINEKFSFIKTYSPLVIGVFTAIMVLLALILSLFRSNRLRKKALMSVEEKNIALQKLYENIAASEEELKAQNEELIEAHQKMEHMAYYDHLTQIPNRVWLEEQMNILIKECQEENTCLLLHFIDLDNFKDINNSYGHAIGDQVLLRVAQRLYRRFHGESLLSRIGGDEFIVVEKSNCKDKDRIKASSEKLLAAFNEPFEIANMTLQVSCSIGVSEYPGDGMVYDDLLVRADLAMFQVKNSGKANWKKFVKNIEKKD